MKNRKLLLIVSLVLAMTMSLGGTLAYLTDTDSDVNTMVLGNVKIEQHEYERVPDGNGGYKKGTVDERESYLLQDFTQDKPLLPIVGDPNEDSKNPAYAGFDEKTTVRMSQVDSYGGMQVFAGKNAQDKFVTVENTGNTPAYVRTYVAIEVGSTKNENPHATGKALVMTSSRAVYAVDVGTDKDDKAPWIVTGLGIVEINGNNYEVREYLYRGADDVNRHVNGVLPAKDTTYPSLCQVYVKHQATNEDLQNLDGNNNGKLDILVLSQAVQADGFADAATALEAGFPKGDNPAETIAAWFGDVLEEDDTLDISFADFIAKVEAGNGTFDGEGVIVTLKDTERNYQNTNTAQFFVGSKTVNIDSNLDTVKISNVTFQFVDDETTNKYTSGELQVFAKNMTFEDCTFIGTSVCPWETNTGAKDCENATFTNCTWKNLQGRYGIHQNTAKNLTVTSCDFINCERGIHTNSSFPESIKLIKNNFTGIADSYGVLCLAEFGDYTNATLTISGNKADDQVCLRQLNTTTTLAQVNTVLNGIRHGVDYVAGAIVPAE